MPARSPSSAISSVTTWARPKPRRGFGGSSRDDQRVFVAEVNRVLVGWVHAIFAEYFEAEAFVLIGGLVVDRNHRRQGIAGMLMASAEEWARERGCSIVRLSSSSTRSGAHRFYERIGYEHIKTQYAFVKALDLAGQHRVQRFVPKVE